MNRGILIQKLQFASQVAATNGIIPIVECVYFGKQIICDNLETRISVNNDEYEGDDFVVSAKDLLLVLSRCKEEEVSIKILLETILVRCGSKEFVMNRMDNDQFPTGPDTQGTEVALLDSVDCLTFKKMIPFIGKNIQRPAMHGVLVSETGEFCATDANKIQVEKINGTAPKEPFILLESVAKAMLAMPNDYTILTYADSERMEAKAASWSIVWRKIDERYPDYRAALPGEAKLEGFRVLTSEVVDYISGIKGYIPKERPIVFEVKADKKLKLHSSDGDLNKEANQIIGFTGECKPGLRVGLNQRILEEAIKAQGSLTYLCFGFMECTDRSSYNRIVKLTENTYCMPVMLNNY